MTPRWWQIGVRLAAGAVIALGLAGNWWEAATTGRPSRVAVACLWTLGAAALRWRRRRPLGVVAVEVAAAVATSALGPDVGSAALVLPVALYTLTVTGPPARAIRAGAASIVLVAAARAAFAGSLRDMAPLVPEVALTIAAVAVGHAVASQRALLRTYQDRAEQAEREQRLHAAQAVAEERVRLARELHDVVAHHVSLLVVQAGAVRETLPADHVTRPLLDSMIDGGRTAMGELRQMLGALRVDGGDAPRAPQPTLDHLGDLVAGATAAGVPVSLQVGGVRGRLPEAASLSAYRVVQEALTNVVRHAPGAFTVVEVDHHPDRVEVVVRNGPSPAAAPLTRTGAGHGLIGMRERAAQVGGTLAAGPAGDGWEVRAVLPA